MLTIISKLNKNMTLPKSSADPTKISLTIKGALLALIPVAVLVARSAGIEVTENELVELANNLVALVSLALVVWGGVRRLVNKLR